MLRSDLDAAQATSASVAFRWTHILGAFASLGLVVALAVWGYFLVVREVEGIPIVRANAEPIRITPEEPGGELAPHQGLAVNEVLDRGEVAQTETRLVLAPEPVSLSQDDLAPSRLRPMERVILGVGDMVDGDTGLEQFAARVSQETAPLSQDPQRQAVQTQTAPAVNPIPVAPLPKLRPKGLTLASLDVRAALEEAMPRAGQAQDIPPGTRLVQIGAFASQAIAEQEWAKMSERFEPILKNKIRVIQKTQSSGRVFYRLRAMGFEGIEDARRFCSALKAQRFDDCIPVLTK